MNNKELASSYQGWHNIACMTTIFEMHIVSQKTEFCVEINKDHPNENKQCLVVQSLLHQGGQPPSLGLGRDSKVDRGVARIYNRKKGNTPGMF